jgi:hypothetical protein
VARVGNSPSIAEFARTVEPDTTTPDHAPATGARLRQTGRTSASSAPGTASRVSAAPRPPPSALNGPETWLNLATSAHCRERPAWIVYLSPLRCRCPPSDGGPACHTEAGNGADGSSTSRGCWWSAVASVPFTALSAGFGNRRRRGGPFSGPSICEDASRRTGSILPTSRGTCSGAPRRRPSPATSPCIRYDADSS